MNKIKSIIFLIYITVKILLVSIGPFLSVLILLKISGVAYNNLTSLILFSFAFVVLEFLAENITQALLRVVKFKYISIFVRLNPFFTTFILMLIVNNTMKAIDISIIGIIIFTILYGLLMDILEILTDKNTCD